MNEAIATVGSNAAIIIPNEDALGRKVTAIEAAALQAVVTNDDEFAYASEIIRKLKQTQKKVTEFWEPLRVSTKKSYDEVLAKKKMMLEPLQSAEKILSGKMGDYSDELDRKRRLREEKMRQLAKLEMESKIAEAAELEAAGDMEGAQFAREEAEVMADVVEIGEVVKIEPQAKGVSTSRVWEIVALEATEVPITVAGVPVSVGDKRIVERLVKEALKVSDGNIIIPGVVFKEATKVRVRT